jgi:hypothetical protein
MPGKIFERTEQIVDSWLGLDESFPGTPPKFAHKTTLNRLNAAPPKSLDGLALVKRLDKRIEANWDASQKKGPRLPSQENWRWKKMPYISEGSTSEEKTLEKAIANITNDDWVNQVPTSSGLVDPGDTHCNIDLVERHGTNFSFIELKVKSNTPLFAAIECVLYGVVYAFTRRKLTQLDFSAEKKPMLAATHIDLVVLAPRPYFEGWDLQWLNDSLSSGLREYSRTLDYTFDFAFQSFPVDFVWEGDSSNLQAVLDDRSKLYTDATGA